MHRPFTRRQALQNRRFLRALRATGNPRLAADLLGVHRSTYTKRRKKSPAFASAWDAELAAAHADFHARGGVSSPAFAGEGNHAKHGGGASLGLRTKGGELTVNRTRNGRLQLRRAPKGWMTKAGEQAFFAALSATANVRLSAAAAGFTHSAFYQKKRRRKPFAREMRLALKTGYCAVEAALLAAGLPESHEDDAWRHNDPPPIPPMTPGQALQLLFLHQKRVDHGDLPDPLRRRRGESHEAMSMRLSLMYEARLERDREAFRLAEAAREGTLADFQVPEDEEEMPVLPALEQVTGWSKAKPQVSSATSAENTDGARRPTGPRSGARSTSRDDGAVAGPVHNPDLALFGGWRLKDWERSREK